VEDDARRNVAMGGTWPGRCLSAAATLRATVDDWQTLASLDVDASMAVLAQMEVLAVVLEALADGTHERVRDALHAQGAVNLACAKLMGIGKLRLQDAAASAAVGLKPTRAAAVFVGTKLGGAKNADPAEPIHGPQLLPSGEEVAGRPVLRPTPRSTVDEQEEEGRDGTGPAGR